MYYSMARLHCQKYGNNPNVQQMDFKKLWHSLQAEHYTAMKNESFLPTETENASHKNIKQSKSDKNNASCMTPLI